MPALMFIRVLLFPPLSSRRRFLIHHCCSELGGGLGTFSVGGGDARRTAVALLSDVVGITPAMGLSQTEHHAAHQPIAGHAGGVCRLPAPAERSREATRSGPSKQRRPDRAVYVPRARRSADPAPPAPLTPHTPPTPPAPPAPPAARSQSRGRHPAADPQPPSPRKSVDKKCFQLYTPPHLRAAPKVPSEPSRVPNISAIYSDSSFNSPPFGDNASCDYAAAVDGSDHDSLDASSVGYNERDSNFYADDFVANGAEVSDISMAVPDPRDGFIEGDPYGSKDEDVEKNELKRASLEINRSNRRIIKQSFDSDVLVISDPVDAANTPEAATESLETVEVTKKKLEAKVSLKREENDWDAVFDDDGECLDPSLLEELSSMVGKAHIAKPRNNYEPYLERQALNGEEFGHVIEVYDFPTEFKTNDLLSVFSEYKDTGFEIKWVDDTHALIVFSSAKIAAEVMSNPHPMVRCRPLSDATADSKGKAKRCAQFLQPYRQRPETCTALARRLVSGALGVRLSTARQERAEERRLIGIAKERKRQAALHKEAAWDGSLADSPQLHDT